MARHGVGEGKGGRNKGEMNVGHIKVDSDKIRDLIKGQHLSVKSVSAYVLRKDGSTLRAALIRNSLSQEDFDKIMEFFKIPEDERDQYLYKEKDIYEEDPAKTKGNDILDLLVVGVNTIYETQSDTNKLLKELIGELKLTNTRLERLGNSVRVLENSNGQILTKSIMSIEKQDDILVNIQDIKSTINVMKGRVTDIRNVVEADVKSVKEAPKNIKAVK